MLEFIGVCKETGAAIYVEKDNENKLECIVDLPDNEATADYTSKKGDYVHVGVHENLAPYTRIRTISISKEKGIMARQGVKKNGKPEIVNYLFDKSKWDLKRAKEWVKKHRGSKAKATIVSEYPVARRYYFGDESHATYRSDGSVYMTDDLTEDKEEILTMIVEKEQEAYARSLEDEIPSEDIETLKKFLDGKEEKDAD